MSPAGRTSGEYPLPVSQEQFDGFATEVRGFMGEQRSQNSVIMSMLSEGQATMAVLRRDTGEYKKRSDEASSKIRLLIQSDAIRKDREEQGAIRPVPPAPPPKLTFWQDAFDELRKKAVSVAAVIILVIAYDQLQKFFAAHPALAADGDGISLPVKEHHGDRAAVPASTPSPSPPAPARGP